MALAFTAMKQAFILIPFLVLAGCETTGPGGGLQTDDTFTATVNGMDISTGALDETTTVDEIGEDGAAEAAGDA